MNRRVNRITAIYTWIDSETAAEHGGSIRIQERKLTQYAQKHGLDNIRVFSDCGSEERSVNRPAFRELLAAIKSGQVAALVVSSLDRLCQDYMEHGHILEGLLAQNGVILHSLREGIVPESGGGSFQRDLFPGGENGGRTS
ncbi:MAG: recombinase family protein [Muribaculaceae bacterium]|nr:recombinase family protein [Muribaculaceae bacterium]